MKYFLVTLAFAALICCLFNSVEAAPERQKRSLATENCPANSTPAQCLAYANAQSKTHKHCHRFVMTGDSIQWQSCGSVSCGGNTRKVPEDLSKPYPACCETCEVVDPSKPATISGVA